MDTTGRGKSLGRIGQWVTRPPGQKWHRVETEIGNRVYTHCGVTYRPAYALLNPRELMWSLVEPAPAEIRCSRCPSLPS